LDDEVWEPKPDDAGVDDDVALPKADEDDAAVVVVVVVVVAGVVAG